MTRFFTRIVVMLIAISGLASCSKDESPSLLCGTWEEELVEYYKNGQIEKTKKGSSKWAFQKDGTLINFSPYYTDKGIYEYNQKNKWIRLKYYVNYNEWKSWEEDYKVEIIELTETELIWKKIYEDDEYDYLIIHLKKTSSEYDD